MTALHTGLPILIASDHAGVELKTALQRVLSEWKWRDLGPISSERVDYPDFAQDLAERVSKGESNRGILICGSGIGMSIAANKVAGVRAAVVENPVAAKLSREHNDANVLCLGARFLAPEYAADIARIWLETPFSGDARHKKRVEKLNALDKSASHDG
jgi:ribose 5-phosphate isomerase B